MKPKYYIPTILIILGLLILPKLAFANGMGAFSFVLYLYLLIPIVILVELFVFWLLAKKIFKLQINFLKILLVTAVTNIPVSLLGYHSLLLKSPFHVFFAQTSERVLLFVGIFLIFLILVEWGIYILFFRKTNIKIFDLLKISFIVNSISTIFINILTICFLNYVYLGG